MMEIDCDECQGCGTSCGREDFTLSVMGTDVISLFPSLDSKIVREEVEKSTIKVEGFNQFNEFSTPGSV